MTWVVLIPLAILYLLAAVAFAQSIQPQRAFFKKWAYILSGVCLIFHAALILGWFWQKGLGIPTTALDRHLLLTFILAPVGWFVGLRTNGALIATVVLPMVAMGLLLTPLIAESIHAKATVPLPTLWLATHILLMILGEALFALAATISIVYIGAEFQLRHRKLSALFARIPSLPDLELILVQVLRVGFILLTIGLALGFVFADSYWSAKWVLDAKVIFCVLTWILYASLFCLRRLNPFIWKGRRTAYLAFLGFLAILFLAWGVESLFPSQHRMEFRIEGRARPQSSSSIL